jgi:uracil phosphoribosyltransferase
MGQHVAANDAGQLVIVAHPLVQHKLTLIRSKDTSTGQFRQLLREIGLLMLYEATRDLPLEEREVETPLARMKGRALSGKKLCFVPILRAGLGMLPGVLDMIPAAKVSVVGLQRDEETLKPIAYYEKLTGRMDERIALIVEPMLATAGTLVATVDMLKAAGCRRIKGLFLVAAPEGLKRIEAAHPDVEIYTAAIDDHLNEHGYILPGLGDAGDKIFGTKQWPNG